MNETQEMNSEQIAPLETDTHVSSEPVMPSEPVLQSPIAPETENVESISDVAPVVGDELHPQPVKEPVPVVTSSGGVTIGDVWSNEETSFRVDSVTAVGGVSIRFRTKDTLDGSKSSFIRKARALFEKKKPLPHGEWFFASGEEIRQFVEQNVYKLEKRKEEEKEPIKAE